ncbi:DUF1611 domain-containing protein [Maribacter antarcticus]|uniref:DUF1611 domain-containing protein n=1 Tax=Maribacter antarcticus TaxID=505250 RepID=UPI00055A44F6|nr:DUF1611 domain-containing protein [Maribacter antarcticus]
MKTIELKAPYLIFIGDETIDGFAKTGFGIVEWRRSLCKGQMNVEGGTVDLGLPPMTIKEATEANVKSLIIGTAAIGGGIPDIWIDTLVEALLKGIDIVAGVHTRLKEIPRLREAAEQSGARLVDVRNPPEQIPVGNGKKRTGRRLLTVGTDCSSGKKYTALALEKDMKGRGMNVDFRASGQTGIMIAGKGIPIDSVVADFISGAAELLSPDNNPGHWDIIEGQGSIFHPGYGAVSMGLLVGSQPDAFVVCHEANRKHMMGWDNFPLPTIRELIERTIQIGKLTNKEIRCVGVSVNTAQLTPEERKKYLDNLSQKIGLPCVDSLKNGTKKIIDYLEIAFNIK